MGSATFIVRVILEYGWTLHLKTSAKYKFMIYWILSVDDDNILYWTLQGDIKNGYADEFDDTLLGIGHKILLVDESLYCDSNSLASIFFLSSKIT